MTTLRVHFDGRMLIPDMPVDLPRDRALEAHVFAVDEDVFQTRYCDLPIEKHPRTGFPVFKMPADAREITMEDVFRVEDEL